jgi:hypothetical protein
MSTAGEMIDDLRDRLNDIADTQVPFPTKLRFLNRGQAAMYPRIYRIVRDSSLALVAGTYEYVLPAGVGTGKVLTVETETDVTTDRYTHLNRYDLIPGVATPTLVLLDAQLPSPAGSCLRITSADRMTPFVAATYAASQSVVYTGPAGTEELPILYAMGLATARVLDDRMDYTRYSATQVNGTVDPNDIMQVSQFWFAQFELLLDRLQMPFPVTPAG